MNILDKLEKEEFKDALAQYCFMLAEIQNLGKYVGSLEKDTYISDKVKGSSKNKPYALLDITIDSIDTNLEPKLEVYRNLIQKRLEPLLEQEIKVATFISKIDDSLLRQIFTFRYINQLGWIEMEVKFKEEYDITVSGESLRKKHERYFT